ncbi:MAG TPA: folate-binding protein [Hyphomicrobium sp.]|nr:folate-binding protein [Hyphomicrobium sp.]
MAEAFIAPLGDRGVATLSGPDAAKLLNGLVTNEVARLPEGEAAHAGLLSPQGKILFDFLALRTAEGFLLDVAREKAADLVKRLGMYKLRAAVAIADVSDRYDVWGMWGDDAATVGAAPNRTRGGIVFRDPRHAGMGARIFTARAAADDVPAALNARLGRAGDYHAHRIVLGVPEGGKDYDFGDAYPHEADFDLFNGVSFTKGCYVGQEVVSRMQHKTVVRKRVVRITGESALAPGAEVTVKGAVIGRTGSVDGRSALAMIRLDRYVEFINAHEDVLAGATRIHVGDADMARYAACVAAREKA